MARSRPCSTSWNVLTLSRARGFNSAGGWQRRESHGADPPVDRGATTPVVDKRSDPLPKILWEGALWSASVLENDRIGRSNQFFHKLERRAVRPRPTRECTLLGAGCPCLVSAGLLRVCASVQSKNKLRSAQIFCRQIWFPPEFQCAPTLLNPGAPQPFRTTALLKANSPAWNVLERLILLRPARDVRIGEQRKAQRIGRPPGRNYPHTSRSATRTRQIMITTTGPRTQMSNSR